MKNSHGGTMITYGGMSKEPVIVPTSALIFKDIQLKGFWMTRWKHTHTKQEVMAMHDELFELISKNQLRVSPLEEIPFGKAAVDPKLLQGLFESSGKKKILIFEE
ncbi:hypothetical protein HMI54_010390 [Coelomomyces lativittatus]|nr:hypothetical protein HMI56_005106 [Coelomomyces lativittatus]KAJ1500938.1 hypothetical protein HMI54_010390 [Coelomomyces lativittatus]